MANKVGFGHEITPTLAHRLVFANGGIARKSTKDVDQHKVREIINISVHQLLSLMVVFLPLMPLLMIFLSDDQWPLVPL